MAVPIGTCTALARFIGGSVEMPVNGSAYLQMSENLYTNPLRLEYRPYRGRVILEGVG